MFKDLMSKYILYFVITFIQAIYMSTKYSELQTTKKLYQILIT